MRLDDPLPIVEGIPMAHFARYFTNAEIDINILSTCISGKSLLIWDGLGGCLSLISPASIGK